MTQPEAIQPAIDAGMVRQLKAFNAARAGGMPRAGWKIGINDPNAQQRIGLSAPIVGWLDGRRVFEAGQPYRPRAGALPRIEAEVAILLGSDVNAGASRAFARSAVASVSAAIEFVDGTKPRGSLEEMLAHDIFHDGVLFGPEHPLEAAGGLVANGFPAVAQNGAEVRKGLPGRYPDDLAELVVHVANVLGRYGESLKAGDRIIGGSFIDPFDVAVGDKVTANFGPLGMVAFEVG
jgi:2-keto-4-pentenoate hydratase